jgi:hypothetical protein
MSSTRLNNNIFEFDEEISLNRRPSIVPRQISFSQREATFGEIILVILPYFILLFDIFIFFILRGFKFSSYDESIIPDSQSNN